jgi:hypothetical protein
VDDGDHPSQGRVVDVITAPPNLFTWASPILTAISPYLTLVELHNAVLVSCQALITGNHWVHSPWLSKGF